MSVVSRAVRAGATALAQCVLCAAAAQAAGPLVADLSSPEVAITTGFTGTDVLLFGAIEGGGDVVVVVRGPERREIVRRKVRVAGIWVNGDAMAFDGAPAFYRIASTRPLRELIPASTLAARRIGARRLDIRPVGAAAAADAPAFREALLRNKMRAGLYGDGPARVRMVDGRLFRTNVLFPANVPTGAYSVETHLVRDGEIVNIETTPLTVRKVGLGASIYGFAHRRSALYGVVAVAVAMLAGWIAGVLFRKA